jgi:polyisoprenyl-phosphate glycosyltransferase
MNLVFDQVIRGWTSLAVLVSFLSGVQLLTLGVLGEYLGQVLDESKRRPLYLVAESYVPPLRATIPPPASPLPHG